MQNTSSESLLYTFKVVLWTDGLGIMTTGTCAWFIKSNQQSLSPEAITYLSCWTQMSIVSIKFILLVKACTITGIFTLIKMFSPVSLKGLNCWYFLSLLLRQISCSAGMSMVKFFHKLGPWQSLLFIYMNNQDSMVNSHSQGRLWYKNKDAKAVQSLPQIWVIRREPEIISRNNTYLSVNIIRSKITKCFPDYFPIVLLIKPHTDII